MSTRLPPKDFCINYIEFNVSNMDQSKDFYAKAFGWSFTDFGPDYCGFSDGQMCGGFDATVTVNAAGGPLVILYAKDLEQLKGRVETAGGKIVKPLFEFPGGRRFHFTDPDGYELAVWSDT